MANTAVTGKDFAGASYPTDTETQPNGDHRQVVAVGDPIGTAVSRVLPYGALVADLSPVTWFIDTFEGTVLDTVDRWTVPAGATAPTVSNGNLNLLPGTGIGGFSALQTKPLFGTQAGAFNRVAFRVALETSAPLNNAKFWGAGFLAASPTPANPVVDGYGFETTDTGVLQAVVYAAGARVFSQALTRPTDGTGTLYEVLNRGRVTHWTQAGVVVATTSGFVPDRQLLPACAISVNGATAPLVSPTMAVTVASVADLGRNAAGISDGDLPFRRARVTAAKELVVTPVDVTGSGSITTADVASTTTAFSPVPSVPTFSTNRMTGTPTAGSAVALDITADSAFSIDVAGTFVGTLQVERTVDGVVWTAVNVFVAGAPITTAVVNAPVALHGNTSAAARIRLRATAWTSGTATVFIRSGLGVGTVTLGSPVKVADSADPRRQLLVDAAGAARVLDAPEATAALTSVTAAAASTSLLAANAARVGVSVFNDSTATLFLALAATASITAYTVKVPAGGYWEDPGRWVGAVSGIWSAANGAARVTERSA